MRKTGRGRELFLREGLKKKKRVERRRIGGKKKRVDDVVYKAETMQPFKPCEPATVDRTGRSDRGPDGSMLFRMERFLTLNGP